MSNSFTLHVFYLVSKNCFTNAFLHKFTLNYPSITRHYSQNIPGQFHVTSLIRNTLPPPKRINSPDENKFKILPIQSSTQHESQPNQNSDSTIMTSWTRLESLGRVNNVHSSHQHTLPLFTRKGPSIGRTVRVRPDRAFASLKNPFLSSNVNSAQTSGQSLVRALRRLDSVCSRNRIRSDFLRQRFHERPGRKRKRLRSERWRRIFALRFKSTLRRILSLKASGW